jgi:isopenicillin N synthase-like dioxygenase
MILLPEDAVDKFLSDGFLKISLTETVYKTITDTFQTAYPFFRASSEEKILNCLPDDGGYRPFGIEYSKSPDSPDELESFTASNRSRFLENKLPTATAQLLHRRMLIVFDLFISISENLTARLEKAISGCAYEKKPKGAFDSWSRIQLNYSRPNDTKSAFINDAHEDGVLITITCATGPGLEIQTASGNFVPVTTSPGEVLIIPSDITWLLSGGIIQPVYHQVRPVGNQSERLALVFLGDLDPKLCKPWLINEVNENVDIGSRVIASANRFGLQGFTPE